MNCDPHIGWAIGVFAWFVGMLTIIVGVGVYAALNPPKFFVAKSANTPESPSQKSTKRDWVLRLQGAVLLALAVGALGVCWVIVQIIGMLLALAAYG